MIAIVSFFLVGCYGGGGDDSNDDDPDLSSAKDITGFSFLSGVIRQTVISGTEINVTIAYPSNGAIPEVEHTGKSYYPTGAISKFGEVIAYTVTAEDASQKKYQVLVKRALIINNATELSNALDAIDADSGLRQIDLLIKDDIKLSPSRAIPSSWANKGVVLENNNSAKSSVTITGLIDDESVLTLVGVVIDDDYDPDACLLPYSASKLFFADAGGFSVESLIALKNDKKQKSFDDLLIAPSPFAPAPQAATCPTVTNESVFNLDNGTPSALLSDPLAPFQWHLQNVRQKSGVPTAALKAGEDLNVTPVWSDDIKGSDVTIGIVDNGTDFTHPDLAPTKSPLSYNYYYDTNDPYPVNTTSACAHGTMTAGIAGARGNGVGVMGVAPNANIAGLNIGIGCGFNSHTTSVADALSADVDISSNSWGHISPGANIHEYNNAIIEGAAMGRDGNGTVYVFAAGNDRSHNGNGNYDSIQSLFQSISVAALASDGKYAYYSNKGANLLVSAYGGEPGANPGILTTDIKGCDKGHSSLHETKHALNINGEYTAFMNGTSAATPMVSGVVALMLEANQSLTWRDVRYILATTARKNDPSNSGWKTNGAGWHINHDYGFGAVDAYSAVEKAKTFESLGALIEREYTDDIDKNADFSCAMRRKIDVSGSGINKIEHVDVWVDINDSAEPLQLNITLISPSGTTSELAYNDYSGTGIAAWSTGIYNGGFRFGTARHLDESADGTWTLKISGSSQTRLFRDWKIKIYGRSN
jgi:subtilisin family serine protease